MIVVPAFGYVPGVIELIQYKLPFTNPVKLKMIEHGTRTDVLNKLAGNIRVDESSISETMWLTKYFGNYNITKYKIYY